MKKLKVLEESRFLDENAYAILKEGNLSQSAVRKGIIRHAVSSAT